MARSIVPVTFEDDRRRAQRRLPRQLYEFVTGGSFAEQTLAANSGDFARVLLKQRVLRDISNVSLATTVFGETWEMPLGLAPVGLAGLMRRRGEVQALRAAEAAGAPMVLSTAAICSIEEVKAAASKPFWYQLYFIRDRQFVAELIGRAKKAGCTALVMTVDLAVGGLRHRDTQTGMTGVAGAGKLSVAADYACRWHWLWDVALNGRPHLFGNLAAAVPDARRLADFYEFSRRNWDPTVNWADVAWVRTLWDGPLVLKGILDPDDARLAVEAGVDGLIVSNHGGRQLDGAPSGISMLPSIVEAVGRKAEIFLDGGVRNGIDVLRARALGARACFVGRPWALALAADGEAGVARMLDRFKREMVAAMSLMGRTDVSGLGEEAIAAMPPEWRRRT